MIIILLLFYFLFSNGIMNELFILYSDYLNLIYNFNNEGVGGYWCCCCYLNKQQIQYS